MQRKRYIEAAIPPKTKMADDPDVMLVRLVMAGGPTRWLWYQPEALAAERETNSHNCEQDSGFVAIEMPGRGTTSLFRVTIAGFRRARAVLSEALRRRRGRRHPSGGRVA